MDKRILNSIKKYWYEFVWDKCTWQTFYARMSHSEDTDKNKERYIQPKLPHYKTVNLEEKIKRGRELVEKQARTNHAIEQAKRINPDYYRIEITYPKEVAEVFIKAYIREINTLEDKILDNDDLKVIKQLNIKLWKLKEEYKNFLLFNNPTKWHK